MCLSVLEELSHELVDQVRSILLYPVTAVRDVPVGRERRERREEGWGVEERREEGREGKNEGREGKGEEEEKMKGRRKGGKERGRKRIENKG